ncbi:MAG: DUF4293 family protein [Flavobacteriales bacterium]|nr:DUF4293 family protein [Flavobacteriales bacterium]
MIQRRQSLYLLAAALLAAAAIFRPIATYRLDEGRSVVFLSTGLEDQAGSSITEAEPRVPFAALFGLLSAGLVVSIFLFKDRPRQMRVVRGLFLLGFGVLAFLVITDRSIQVYLTQGQRIDVSYGAPGPMLIAMLLLLFLAERAIRADDELVRSADRLR